MRTLKLTIAYDGTRYAGWQRQDVRGQTSEDRRQKSGKPTIQGTLEAAFRTILRERVPVVGSGRTDAGVHALAQVAHVRTRSRLPRERLLRSANALLPPDIAVLRVDEAPAGFHARYGATGKTYRYRLFTRPVVSPFIRLYVCHVRAPLNARLMRREAACLRGRHDFKVFVRQGGAGRKTVRTIRHVRLVRRGPELILELSGDGFLHLMVRRIVGTLVDIGRGHRPPGTMAKLLKTRDRRVVGRPTAPAKGLWLVRVEY